METLTQIQQSVYDFTRQALDRGEPFPSLRDIAAHFDFQHTTARFHLKALEKKGYIQQRNQRVSEYMLGSEDDDGHYVGAGAFNLVGRIPAGAPLSVYDETPESFSVNHDFFGGGEIVGIRVSGESMIGDSIADGDIAMIRRQQEAIKGDILAVRIEGEITLKRIRLRGSQFELIPSNPEFSSTKVPASQLEILGKLVGIIRKT
jgi:repressor LexA